MKEKNKMNSKIRLSLLIAVMLVFFLTLSVDLIAQPPAMLSDPQQTPIDGGLGILAASGAVMAFKKLRNRLK